MLSTRPLSQSLIDSSNLININAFQIHRKFSTTEFNTLLRQASYEIIRSPGDGHCLIHSIQTCLRHQKIALPREIVEIVQSEVLQNLPAYSRFAPSDNIISEMSRYILNKDYNSLFGDMLSDILANALKCAICILNKQETNYNIIWINEDKSSETTLFVHRSNHHYKNAKNKVSLHHQKI